MELNRVLLVYKKLGQVLNSPQSFGLGDRAPKPLIEVLTAARQNLREEVEEEGRWPDEDWLSEELSQDADQPESLIAKRAGQRWAWRGTPSSCLRALAMTNPGDSAAVTFYVLPCHEE